MKRNAVRSLVCLLAVLVFLPMTAGIAGNTKANTTTENRLAILVVTDNAFATLNTAGQVSAQEAITAFVKAAEGRNIKIRLQGTTTNAYASSLRYATEDGGSIDWTQMPTKGNRRTFANTFGRLSHTYTDLYSDYNQIMVISGSLSDPRQDLAAVRNVNFSVPTWLYQTTDLVTDHNLLEAYSSVSSAGFEDTGTISAGFSVYNGRGKDEDTQGTYPVLFKQVQEFSAENMFKDLMRGYLYKDSYMVKDGVFGLASDLIDSAMLVIEGDTIADIELIGPDGARYQAASSNESNGNNLPITLMDWGTRKIGLISLDKIVTTGEWVINGIRNCEAELYYARKENFTEIVSGSSIVDPAVSQNTYTKGESIFTLYDGGYAKDLFLLYPDLVMKITDTQNQKVLSESISDVTEGGNVNILFHQGGEHQLVFRLMNGNEEVLAQTVMVNVTDQPLNFVEQQPVRVLFDTLENRTWTQDATAYFHDPDSDEISISRVGGSSGTVVLKDNKLILALSEDAQDGEETVTLKGISDTAEATGSISITWKSVTRLMKGLSITCQIESANGEEKLVKLLPVVMKAKVLYEGNDLDVILKELDTCQASLTDMDGNTVAAVRFNRESLGFESDQFQIPNVSGEYTWALNLQSAEGSLPEWSRSIKSGKVIIQNNAPVIDHDKIAAELFGEKHLFHYDDWNLMIPADLATDPDGDPIHYEIYLNKEKVRELSSRNDFEEPLTMPGFGGYDIEIVALDHENSKSIESIEKSLTLIDLKEEIMGLDGKYTVTDPNPSGKYTKRGNINISLAIDTTGWSEEKKAAVGDWISSCKKTLLVNGELNESAYVQFDKDSFTLSSDVTVPGSEGTYAFGFCAADAEQEELEKKFSSYEISVEDNAPELVDSGAVVDSELWLMHAEEYLGMTIPRDFVTDPDGDELKCSVKVIRIQKNSDPPEVVVSSEEGVELPYVVHFPAFDFFDMQTDYRVEASFADNDGQTKDVTISVKLKNQLLLIIIIAAVVVLVLAIIALLLYLRYKKNLPAFRGAIQFTWNGKPVSGEIGLEGWMKQKHLPLSQFAGAITKQLTDDQWNKLKSIELRPNKEFGFTIHGLHETKGSYGEIDMPYDLGEGLKIEKIG